MTKTRVIKIISRWKLRDGVRMVHSKALAENGQLITEHWSSDFRWVEHDMGITSNWKHHKYIEFYPEDYTLKWDKDETNAGEVTIENGRKLYVVQKDEYYTLPFAVTTSEVKALKIIREALINDGLEAEEVDEMIEDGDYGDWYSINTAAFQV